MATQSSAFHRSEATSRRVADLPKRDTALYIADMALELRNLAKSAHMPTLQGYLEMAYYEAFTVGHGANIPVGEEEYLRSLGADARKAELVDAEPDRLG